MSIIIYITYTMIDAIEQDALTPTTKPQKSARTGPPPQRNHPVAISYQTRVDAERWRGQFLGALRGAQGDKTLHEDLVAGIEKRQWTHLSDEHGKLFRDFDAFCAAQAPFGLGQTPDVVRGFLGSLLGARQTDLLLVAPSRQGIKDDDPASRHRGGKSERQEERLRAISCRAPEPVFQLYTLGILPQRQAERLGRRNPTQEEQAAAEAFARTAQTILADLGEDRSKEAIAEAKARVRLLLPPAPDSVDKVIERLKKLLPAEQDRIRDWLLEHRGTPMRDGAANDVGPIPDVSGIFEREHLMAAAAESIPAIVGGSI